VIGQTSHRHTSAEFVAFLEDLLARQAPEQAIHIICDNLSAHKTKAVCNFLAHHPKVRIHYTPTYSSWLNQVEALRWPRGLIDDLAQ
jgi:transposase